MVHKLWYIVHDQKIFSHLNSRSILFIDLCYPDKIIFISSRNVLIEKMSKISVLLNIQGVLYFTLFKSSASRPNHNAQNNQLQHLMIDFLGR